MATLARKPLEGVGNILRFNWHFYVAVAAIAAGLVVLIFSTNGWLKTLATVGLALLLLGIGLSLLVSAWVYDLSGLYRFDFLPEAAPDLLVNIHAGFDESSDMLQAKYPRTELVVLDFYDPQKHTEISIKRARKSRAPFPRTWSVNAQSLPVADASADLVTVFFAAHEIRHPEGRIAFLRELNRILKPTGKIILAEHLRDGPNTLAYSVGVFHFYSRNTWLRAFAEAGLQVVQEEKHTPFVTLFTLSNHAA